MKFESLPRRTGAKDVLCQHLLLLACGKGFCPKNTYSEIIKAFLTGLYHLMNI